MTYVCFFFFVIRSNHCDYIVMVRGIFVCLMFFFFFFKQKTAYEMRISDWSSDVCSSDLVENRRGVRCVAVDHRCRWMVGFRRFFGERPHRDAARTPCILNCGTELVPGDRQRNLGVVQYVLDFGLRRHRVDGHHDTTCSLNPHVRHDEFRHRRRREQNPVADAQPFVANAAGERQRRVVKLSVCPMTIRAANCNIFRSGFRVTGHRVENANQGSAFREESTDCGSWVSPERTLESGVNEWKSTRMKSSTKRK